MNIKLNCRITNCSRTDEFKDVEQVNNSGWDEINSMGSIKNGVKVHRGFCPDHADVSI